MYLNTALNTCENLKFQEPSKFNSENVVSKNFHQIWSDAGSPSNKEMAEAASGDSNKKKAYHLYWAYDPQAIAYLKWLQRDASNNVNTNAYGWAYDEKKWTNKSSWTADGNPSTDNIDLNANRVAPLVNGQSIEIHITDII